jgi:tetratricopeptide (TPR) repeat protein
MTGIRKKLLFNSVLLLIPFFTLALLEISLRILLHNEQPPIVSEVFYDNIEWYQINRDYLKRYFPFDAAMIPEFKPSLFKKHKNDHLFRIICLGGSTMFGTPYQMNSNIPGILRKQLRHLFPEKEIEVINFAASAINSQVISRFSKELLQFQPDLIIIYMGHNEYYGPDGVGATFFEKKVRILTDLKYSLRNLRLYQALWKFISHLMQNEDQVQKMNLMQEVSGGSLIALDSEDSRRIFHLFRQSLIKIIHTFDNEGIPLIISDVASNLDFPPFASSPAKENKINEIFYQVKRLRAGGEQDSALLLLNTFNEKYGSHALLHYWLGKVLEEKHKYEEAKSHFIMAKDNDLLKFRAPSEINRIIEEICHSKNTAAISVNEYFSTLSPGGIEGFNLFWEHLHPNETGYYYIAKLFLEKILELNFISSPRIKSEGSSLLPDHPDSLSICWLDLAYADMAIMNLTRKWPFQNFQAKSKYLHLENNQLQMVVNDVFNRKLLWDEACYKTATIFEKFGKWQQAQVTYQAIIEEYPYNFYAHYHLGRSFKDRGLLNQARKHYLISIHSKPDYVYSRTELGLVEVNLGNFTEAIKQLETALNLKEINSLPAVKANILYGLSAAYANLTEIDKALEFVDLALNILPDYQAAQNLRSQLLLFKNR